VQGDLLVPSGRVNDPTWSVATPSACTGRPLVRMGSHVCVQASRQVLLGGWLVSASER
jgi:hypothetical protein